jgi:hypothetical protein
MDLHLVVRSQGVELNLDYLC